MILPDLRYVTKKDRLPVILYNFYGQGRYCIHGYVRMLGHDHMMKWDASGKADPNEALVDIRGTRQELDLIEDVSPKPRLFQEMIFSKFPAPFPERVLKKFTGRRVKVTLEEV